MGGRGCLGMDTFWEYTMLFIYFVCLFFFLQTAAREPVDSNLWCRDKQHRHSSTAQHGEIRLSEVLFYPRAIFPITQSRGQARLLSRMSITRTFRNKHGSGQIVKKMEFVVHQICFSGPEESLWQIYTLKEVWVRVWGRKALSDSIV